MGPMGERLIVFTRYPVPGTTKTRLIPAVGAEKAAEYQRQMSEHTVAIARSLQSVRPVELEIRFTGGTAEQMTLWLGSDSRLVPQGEGDLGDRLNRAFEAAFAEGIERAIAVGIDCPELNQTRLIQAFEHLYGATGVIGPATDGGYYLIGLNRAVPSLFQAIAWGTEAVLQQTQAAAAAHSVALAYLDVLNDVDYPEDLPLWERVQASSGQPQHDVSVILPLLNEASIIDKTLDRLMLGIQASALSIEVIVVDGGSQDDTVKKVRDRALPILQTHAARRARQMNIGAQAATGQSLLFLHGDTWLPEDFAAQIQQTLKLSGVTAGAFTLKIRGSELGLRWVERGVCWRSRLLQMPYGDQGLFMSAQVFHNLGGFPEMPIMEDFEMVRQLKQRGKIAVAPASVQTSARRWQKLGVVRTTLLNQILILSYLLGLPPATLAKWYRQPKR